MRSAMAWVLLFIVSGCGDKDKAEPPPTDTSPTDTSSTDTDTGTPLPETESSCTDGEDNDGDGLVDCADDDCVCLETDCSDGVDDDADGLLDCEDDDCLELCLEDCTDGLDNDQDDATDCADPECYGLDGCGGPYTLQAIVSVEQLSWAGGTDWGTGFYDRYSYNMAVAMTDGRVSIIGQPKEWEGATFQCAGRLNGGFDIIDQPNIFTYIGPFAGLDYVLEFNPYVMDNTLIWDSSCPVSGLPSMVLGFQPWSDYIYNHHNGTWYPHYGASEVRHKEGYGNMDVLISYFFNAENIVPVYWEGFYTPPSQR